MGVHSPPIGGAGDGGPGGPAAAGQRTAGERLGAARPSQAGRERPESGPVVISDGGRNTARDGHGDKPPVVVDEKAPGRAGERRSPADKQKLHRRERTVARWAIEVAVLVAAALFVVRRAGNSIGQVGATFSHLHWHWLFVSAAAECGSIFALSWLQQRLLRSAGVPVSVRNLVPVTAASNAVAQSLPAGLLFAEGYSFRQYQRLGAGRASGVWAELAAGALAAAGLASVAVAGAAVVGSNLRYQLLPAFGFVLAGALVAAALFRRTPLLARLIGSALRFSERALPPSFCGRLRSAEIAVNEMTSFRPSWGVWVACLLAAMLNWGLDALVLVASLLTVGGPVPWRGVLLCYAAAQLLVELPITPGGLGIVEGGLVEVLIRFHVPVSRATAGTLMYRAVSYWLLLILGWVSVAWLTMRNRRADQARYEQAPAQPARVES